MVMAIAALLLFVSTLFNGIWLHFWSYLFGARQGIHRTVQVAFYAATPVIIITITAAFAIEILGNFYTFLFLDSSLDTMIRLLSFYGVAG